MSAHCPGDRTTVRKIERDYDAANQRAANIISNDPAQFPVGGLLHRWATLWLARHGGQREQAQSSSRASRGGQLALEFEIESEAA